MSELVDWLRQRLDEDERMARAATPGPWVVKPADSVYAKPSAVVLRTDVDVDAPWSNEWVSAYVVNPQEEGGEGIDPVDAEHIVRWDPARVLAEVEADRAILDVILAYEAKIDGEWGCCHSAKGIEEGRCPEIRPDEIHAVRLLAQPYAGRPGWRAEWAV